ncbi:MAG: 2-C-methyl-D-erythritol 4-phosphate cytidylyltransferase [Nitrospina sp.]|jgi:2-C-methyl-D-erythritol 4-phosphate cytidylyltransferase|nr:2-C-methyl-D-erythritol 4-phosphate cytidylyltransferase [Nitrospina sp.]MBT3509095.1 2-C-methyl-D-erythritol 4-phosphate cytidylyltransferase [Nitrospina sp.]MBT3876723.1 2-C-methyl-D-erythritol 4-phosphate cytidylyltransferase [Nitrospina sp.]MBT4047850.1 2-C-methyl-D-erythritol 4-phosphate cytidylyltransferase [Nitrospina sp.]MBT4558589.1 2-C-methyl-D-erythritol 4-phosphate cytidylyltransferase [Nitrospina sp.]
MNVCAIIPAGGQGTRMGGTVPKQFQALKGKPVLHYTLRTLQESDLIDSLVLVVPEKELVNARADWLNRPPVVKQVVVGGEKRQDSVFNGYQVLPKNTDIVLVHDGVRPFLSKEMIQETLEVADKFGAAITAIPVNDTLKQVNNSGTVLRTVEREGLWRVQTPQAFRFDLLGEAFLKAQADSFYGTDEGSLIEYLGQEVRIVDGSEWNLKITRPEDLLLGESIAGKLFPDL